MGDFITEIINTIIGSFTEDGKIKISNILYLFFVLIAIGVFVYMCLGGTYVR